MEDENERETAHLLGVYQRTMGLLKRGVKPVWVMDGLPSPLKYREVLID